MKGLPEKLKPRIFAGIDAQELNSILAEAKHRHFPASVVTHEGDAAERFYVLVSGQGRHFVTTTGGRKMLLHWLTAGEVFGGAALLSDPYRYLASTELLSESCVLMWNREKIRELAARYPVLVDNAFSIAVTEGIAWLIAAQVSLSSDDARGRLANLVASLAGGIGMAAADGLELRVTNEDLAAGA
ncbi:MAG: Crp/Fnr family transcriptional regulator, partial [Acidobacteriaceae bacterium]|nr:Crp/Fnr family transcriptional regulator [Acidobacteriaceae bacterium]